MYKIIVKEIKTVERKERNWVQVEPYKNSEGKTENYDYRNEIKEVDVDRDIFTQEKEELDLSKLAVFLNS